jgi:hypothetical protein
MQVIIQEAIVILILTGAFGLLAYKLGSSVKNLVLNRAPSCHGDGDEDCPRCAERMKTMTGNDEE